LSTTSPIKIIACGCLLLLACGEGGTGSGADASSDGVSPDVMETAPPDLVGLDGAASDTAPAGPCAQVVGGPVGGRHVLRFEQASPAARVHLLRRYVRPGAGESAIYDLGGMWVERDGGCVAITEAAALTYTNSHHNWRDRASGTAAGITYLMVMDKDIAAQAWTLELSGSNAGSGGAAFAPVRLTATGGPIGLIEVPTSLPVQVSELLPANTTGWKDDEGEYEPWIELWNPSSEMVDVSGWSLSDDPGQRRRWSLPAGTVIGRHQYLVIAADGQPTQGPLHASFRLAASGGSLVLTNAAGVTAGERAYPAAAANRSLRFSQAIDGFEPSPTVTVGAGSSSSEP
jgi:hypothetical protein